MASRARTQLRSGNLPAVQHAPESAHNADAYLTERSAEAFANTLHLERERAQHMMQHSIEPTTGNLGPVFQSGAIVASAMRGILLELVNLIQDRMHQNFTRLLSLASCRTPTQLFAAQGDLVRDNVEGVLRSTGRIADVSMRMAHEGARRMSAVSWASR